MAEENRVRTLAHKLREARKAAGLNQIESAARLGKSQSYVSRCEAGRRRIDVFELAEFARVYGKAIGFFLEKERFLAKTARNDV